MSDAKPAGPSRRQAARLAAVQALYQWQEGQDAPAEIVEQFLKVRTGEAGEGGMRRDADRPLFKDVVEGTASRRDELEALVSASLAEDWTWARVDRLVRAILLAGKRTIPELEKAIMTAIYDTPRLSDQIIEEIKED